MIATATAPVTVTTAAGTTLTVEMPQHGTTAVYADAAHTAAVAQLAQAPAAVPASVSATGASNGLTVVILGCLIWYAAKHRGHKWGWLFVGVVLGTFIASGSIGIMIHNTVGQLLASIANSVTGVTS
jgi:hypothetical protein